MADIHYLYVFEDPNNKEIKVGIGYNVQRRLNDMRTARPGIVVIRVKQFGSKWMAYDWEQHILYKLKRHSIGGEWLKGATVMTEIDAIVQGWDWEMLKRAQKRQQRPKSSQRKPERATPDQ